MFFFENMKYVGSILLNNQLPLFLGENRNCGKKLVQSWIGLQAFNVLAYLMSVFPFFFSLSKRLQMSHITDTLLIGTPVVR